MHLAKHNVNMRWTITICTLQNIIQTKYGHQQYALCKTKSTDNNNIYLAKEPLLKSQISHFCPNVQGFLDLGVDLSLGQSIG